MAEFCVLCDRERIPYRGLVDESCRRWLAWMLRELPDYAAELAAGPDLMPDRRATLVAVERRSMRDGRDEHGNAVVVEPRSALRDEHDRLVFRHRDPVAGLLPSGSSGNVTGDGHVSGSREAPIPINEDAVDILGRSRQGSRGPMSRGLFGLTSAVRSALGMAPDRNADAADDQCGHLPLATELDRWVREWRDARDVGEGLPPATVEAMCGWLWDRLDWACDEFEPIDDFAVAIREYRSTIKGILGLFDIPDYKTGIACPKCQAMTLFQRIGGVPDKSLWIECAACPAMMSHEEYETYTAELADTSMRTIVTMLAVATPRTAKPARRTRADQADPQDMAASGIQMLQ